MYEIEDKPVTPIYRGKANGFTAQLSAMKVGQSVLSDKSYNSIYQCIRAAKGRQKQPVIGEFLIVPEGKKFRVGRTA